MNQLLHDYLYHNPDAVAVAAGPSPVVTKESLYHAIAEAIAARPQRLKVLVIPDDVRVKTIKGPATVRLDETLFQTLADIKIVSEELLPKKIVQYRFPRSKKRRIRDKWSKRPENWREVTMGFTLGFMLF